jgi:hypothetical protein
MRAFLNMAINSVFTDGWNPLTSGKTVDLKKEDLASWK